MWKVVAFVLAVIALGHLAVRYVRKNPLAPEIIDSQVVVQSQDYEVRFRRSGDVEGTYFIAGVTSEDWSPRPVNATLAVYGMQTGTEYMRSHPDFHLLGSQTSTRLEGVATPLSLVAASREVYGEVRGLIDDHARRERSGGERLCVTLAGEALSVSSAESLEDGRDATSLVAQSNAEPIVYADRLEVADCADLLAARR
jgi:hypothetical protein